MFTLAHLSDPHLPLPHPRWWQLASKRLTGYLNWQRRRHIHDPAVLAAIVADLKAAAPDHIAVTGDIANISLPEEFVRGQAWLESVGAPGDVSFIPGNHDAYVRAARNLPGRYWSAYMSGDDGWTGFPYVRRRSKVALIGVSTGVPTPPFMATGWVGRPQLAALAARLEELKREGLFRVVMIHHPPVSDAPQKRRLLDAADFLRVIAAHGAELVLHGHDHLHMLNWLPGVGADVPAVGVPSASCVIGTHKDPAAYNLYRIGGEPGAWRCEMVTRAIAPNNAIFELKRAELYGVG